MFINGTALLAYFLDPDKDTIARAISIDLLMCQESLPVVTAVLVKHEWDHVTSHLSH